MIMDVELPKPSHSGRRGVNAFGNIHTKAADASPSVTCAIANRRGLTISASNTNPPPHLPQPFLAAQTNSRTFWVDPISYSIALSPCGEEVPSRIASAAC
jgi:hypothetical protein